MIIYFYTCCRISENKWRHLWNGWKSWRNRSRRFPCCRWVLTNFLFSHLYFRNVHRPAYNLHSSSSVLAKRSYMRNSRCFIIISLFPLWRHFIACSMHKLRENEVLVYFQRNGFRKLVFILM